jgi:sporulation protein YlmC with PRC-barrel domain
MPAGRVLFIHLQLLDRQVIDADGRLVCKVDDLELVMAEDGPHITAILVGPRALGPRLGGRIGRWWAAVATRLLGPDGDPSGTRIDFAQVTDLGSAIKLARRADELDVAPLEAWVDRHVIARIPGSTHEGE